MRDAIWVYGIVGVITLVGILWAWRQGTVEVGVAAVIVVVLLSAVNGLFSVKLATESARESVRLRGEIAKLSEAIERLQH